MYNFSVSNLNPNKFLVDIHFPDILDIGASYNKTLSFDAFIVFLSTDPSYGLCDFPSLESSFKNTMTITFPTSCKIHYLILLLNGKKEK
jgi:hypothetical protein